MVVFGADPDAPTKEWDERKPKLFASKPVAALTNYFAYHPNMKMSQRCDDQDKLILHRHFSRALKKGYTDFTLRKMVDRFFQSWAADYETPAYAFVSRKVQDVLELEAEVVKDDPVLLWLLHGMPNIGPFEDSAEMRKCVLLNVGDALHVYPDYVADIIRKDAGYTKTADALEKFESELDSIRPRRPKYDTIHQAIAAIPIKKKSRDDRIFHTD